MTTLPLIIPHPCQHCSSATGPFYVTFAGPTEAFPSDLNSPAKLLLVAKALHGALNLPSSYPATSILVWLQTTRQLPAARRHLLAGQTQAVVIGYTLTQSTELPQPDDLKQAMDNPQASAKAAELLDVGFVAPEHAGLLSVGLTSSTDSQAVVKQLTGEGSGGDNQGAPTGLHLSVIGELAIRVAGWVYAWV